MTAETDVEQKPEMSTMSFIILLVVLVVFALGGGFAVSSYLLPSAPQNGDVALSDNDDKLAQIEKNLRIIELQPITTNLAMPSETWVRAELSVALNEELDSVALADLQTNIVAYFRTVSLDTFRSPSGFQHLVSDLEERVSFFSKGKAERVFIRSLVFE